jgi:hypothetical protein
MRLHPSGLRSSGAPGSCIQQAPSADCGAIRVGRAASAEDVLRHMFYGGGFTAGSPVIGAPLLTVR